MSNIENIISELSAIAASPKSQLKKYKAQGKKCVGVLPYFAPEELVYAADMVPFGVWGSNDKTITRAKEYCATFYCTIAQLALEMFLDGTMDDLDAVITPTICDTLRPMSQNFKVALAGKKKVIFLAHPQNRFDENGLTFCVAQYANVKKDLEEVKGSAISDESIQNAITVYNKTRALKREFVVLAGNHPDVISATKRSAILKASYFMLKDEYNKSLEELNDELRKLPKSQWMGKKVVTSGIILDNPKLLSILDERKIAIVADDVAYESRSFRVDVPQDSEPLMALAKGFASQSNDILLYDPASSSNNRAEYVADLVEKNGADGLILFMQQFCDPEEMEYPYLKKELDSRGIHHIKIGVDQQMRDFGQAATALETFVDMLNS